MMRVLKRILSLPKKIWLFVWNAWDDAQHSALLLFALGLGAACVGYVQQYVRTDWLNFLDNPIADFYANASAEMISIAITVLIIERANRKQNENDLKEQLIFQMGSNEQVTAKAAARMLAYKGWLMDGSLMKVNLAQANLQEAYLVKANLQDGFLYLANLQGVHLEGANLQRVILSGSNLQNAMLWETNLQEADLEEANFQRARLESANLKGANLKEANLLGADLTQANLEGTILNGAILPDFNKWTPDTDMARFTDPNHPDFWDARKYRDEA